MVSLASRDRCGNYHYSRSLTSQPIVSLHRAFWTHKPVWNIWNCNWTGKRCCQSGFTRKMKKAFHGSWHQWGPHLNNAQLVGKQGLSFMVCHPGFSVPLHHQEHPITVWYPLPTTVLLCYLLYWDLFCSFIVARAKEEFLWKARPVSLLHIWQYTLNFKYVWRAVAKRFWCAMPQKRSIWIGNQYRQRATVCAGW